MTKPIGLNRQGGSTGSLGGATHASEARLVIISAFNYSVVPLLSPAMVLVYKAASELMNTTSFSDGNSGANTGITYQEALAHDAVNTGDRWILTRSGGPITPWYGYGGYYGGNIGKASFQARWLANTIAFANAHGFDGVFIDNILETYPGLTDQYPTQASWGNAMASFAAYVGEGLKAAGLYVAFNANSRLGVASVPGDDDGTSTMDWWNRIGSHASALMNEYWQQDPNNLSHMHSSTLGYPNSFEGWLRLVGTAQALGSDFIGLTVAPKATPDYRIYGEAAFLLEWDGGGGCFMYAPSDASDPYAADWYTDIGTPTGPKTTVGNGYMRHYTNGVVVVNPHPSSSQAFTFGASFTPVTGGGAVSGVTLGAVTAMVYYGAGVADVTPPSLTSAVVNTSTLTLAFDETLAGTPTTGDFVVKVGGSPVALSTAARSTNKVTIGLSAPVVSTDVVTVSYTGSTLEDSSGNDVVTFADQAVSNTTDAPDTTPPIVAGVPTATGSTLTIVYSEPLDSGSTPAPSQFTVTVNGVPDPVVSVLVSGSSVILTLTDPVEPDDVVTVDYVATGTNTSDIAGNEADDLTAEDVQTAEVVLNFLDGTTISIDGEPYPPTPTTLSLDAYLTGFNIDRGRPDEFSTQQAGTAELELNNRTGAFEAGNVDSPFYGHLIGLTQTKIRMANPITPGRSYPVFTGYSDHWDYTRQGPRAASVTVDLVDMVGLLANADVDTDARGAPYGAFYAAQHWDDRIKAALMDAGVPPAYFRVSTGNIYVPAHVYTAGSKILEVILDAVEAEFPGTSNCWADPDGVFRASGRLIRGVDGSDPDVNPDYSDFCKRWQVGDAAACYLDPNLLPIFDIKWDRSKETLINRSLITPEGMSTDTPLAPYYRTSPASIAANGPWEKSYTSISMLAADDGNTALDECQAISAYLVGNYGNPHDRIVSIEFHGQMDDGSWSDPEDIANRVRHAPGALWDFILGVDINHIIEVSTFNPPDGLVYLDSGSEMEVGTALTPSDRIIEVPGTGGGFNATEFFVEGIHHRASRLNDRFPKWTMTLDLSLRAKTKKIVDGVVSDW